VVGRCLMQLKVRYTSGHGRCLKMETRRFYAGRVHSNAAGRMKLHFGDMGGD